jgi:hypothetical protein
MLLKQIAIERKQGTIETYQSLHTPQAVASCDELTA